MAFKRYYLDSSAILANPEILSYTGSFSTTGSILQEVASAPVSGSAYATLMAAAAQGGSLQYVDTSSLGEVPQVTGPTRLSYADRELLAAAKKASQGQNAEPVVLVTDDRALAKVAQNIGLTVESSADARNALLHSRPTSAPAPLQAAAADVRRYSLRHLIYSFLLGAVLIALAVLAYLLREWLLATVSWWGVGLIVALAGYLLYRVRHSFRLSYGFAETVVGLVGSVLAIRQADVAADLSLARVLPVAAGLYVIVRGLDNCGQGLKQRSAPAWVRALFP